MKQLISNINKVNPDTRFKELLDLCSSLDIVLYGAGLTGKNILQKLHEQHLHPIYIADDTTSKHGTQLEGVPIVPLEYLITIKQPFVLIVTILNPEINFNSLRARLQKKGIKNVYSFIELCYLYPDKMLPYFHFDRQEVILKNLHLLEKAFDLFIEPVSRELFFKNIEFRLNLDFDLIPLGDKDEYFPSSIISIPAASVFIDCGAFDGDTARSFVSRNNEFDFIYAFEPDPVNFNKLLDTCSFLSDDVNEKVYAFNFGLSSKHSYLKFNSLNNMGSALDKEGNIVIQTIDLDSFLMPLLANYNETIFIKMDIEGEEPNALKGCKNLIKEKSPNLAISVYHNADDLWEIPLYIKSINPGYKFFLRQHGNDSMDLVLYAIPT